MKTNWLSNRIQKGGQGNPLLAEFKRDIDQLISHPSQANWPPDQQATHADQLLAIAAEEQLLELLPDYQLEWLHCRLGNHTNSPN